MDYTYNTQSSRDWESPYLEETDRSTAIDTASDFDWLPESDEDSERRQNLTVYRQRLLGTFDELAAKGYTPLPGGPLDDRRPRLRWGSWIDQRPSSTRLTRLRSHFSHYLRSGKFDWREPPKLMIITGGPYRLVVPDVDPRNGGDVTIRDYETPDTYRVWTPRGGYHLYYRLPPGMRVKNAKLPGVDIQAGCLVAAPPSRRSDGIYTADRSLPPVGELTMAPGWLLDLIGDDSKPEVATASGKPRAGRTKRSGQRSTGTRAGRMTEETGTSAGGRTVWGEEMDKLLHLLDIAHDCTTDRKQNVLCPLHDDDAHPSLSIDLKEGTWNCQHVPSCGKGGVQALKKALRTSDRIHPALNPPPSTPLLSLSGDIRSKLAVCETWREHKNVKHLVHLDRVTQVGRKYVAPCNDCRGCRTFELETRLLEAQCRWPAGEPAYLVKVEPKAWEALRQRIDYAGKLYIRAPQHEGVFAVVTNHSEGVAITDLAGLLEVLLRSVPVNIRGEGRPEHNLTISAALQPPKKPTKPKTGVTRMVQDPERLHRRLADEKRIRSEHGVTYRFDLPEDQGWESDYGIETPRFGALTRRSDYSTSSAAQLPQEPIRAPEYEPDPPGAPAAPQGPLLDSWSAAPGYESTLSAGRRLFAPQEPART